MANYDLNLGGGPIGYYVHHHGTGHMRRAQAILQHISRPVVLFSSLPKPADLPATVTYILLPDDAVADYQQPPNSAFHYTPYDHKVFSRNQVLIDAWQRYNIRQLYVDVSIEVAMLAKLYGLRVGHAGMHGQRTDSAHSNGFQAVDYILVHMAKIFDTPSGRQTTTPLFYSGGISRYKKQVIKPIKSIKTVVVTLSPASHANLAAMFIKAAIQNPTIHWHSVGFDVNSQLPNISAHGVVTDPFEIYMAADVVIGSGGNNTITELASLGKAFICLPEPRPFNEQVAAAESLANLGAAQHIKHWPSADEWPSLWQAAKTLDTVRFQSLVDDNAAAKAAAIIESSGLLRP